MSGGPYRAIRFIREDRITFGPWRGTIARALKDLDGPGTVVGRVDPYPRPYTEYQAAAEDALVQWIGWMEREGEGITGWDEWARLVAEEIDRNELPAASDVGRWWYASRRVLDRLRSR